MVTIAGIKAIALGIDWLNPTIPNKKKKLVTSGSLPLTMWWNLTECNTTGSFPQGNRGCPNTDFFDYLILRLAWASLPELIKNRKIRWGDVHLSTLPCGKNLAVKTHQEVRRTKIRKFTASNGEMHPLVRPKFSQSKIRDVWWLFCEITNKTWVKLLPSCTVEEADHT